MIGIPKDKRNKDVLSRAKHDSKMSLVMITGTYGA